MRGLRPPLWILPPTIPSRRFHRRTGLIHRESVKNGPAGAVPRQTSVAFAEEEGGAAKRPKPDACGRMRDAELVPTRAPLCAVAGKEYIREGPHRKGPSLMRLFGYFFGVEKVTRGVGPGRPHIRGVQSVPLWKTTQTAVWAAAPAAAPGDRSTSPGAAWAIHPGASSPAGRPRPPRRWSSRWAGR